MLRVHSTEIAAPAQGYPAHKERVYNLGIRVSSLGLRGTLGASGGVLHHTSSFRAQGL